jgi:hypothetical protein
MKSASINIVRNNKMKTKGQTIKEHERRHNERQLAISAINLAVAITRASSIGHSLRKFQEANPRYVAQVSDTLTKVCDGYKVLRKLVSKDVAQFYDTQIKGVLGDYDVRTGLSKWEGGLAVKI